MPNDVTDDVSPKYNVGLALKALGCERKKKKTNLWRKDKRRQEERRQYKRVEDSWRKNKWMKNEWR